MAALASALSVAVTISGPSVARADTTSTAAIIAGAALITGALIYDSNSHPYYVRDEHRYYVTEEQATWYRRHHHGNERRAYVPEQEYPVARDYDHRGNHGEDHGRQDKR